MKKILLLVALVAFIISGVWVLAKDDFMVKCCVKGKCSTMTKPECDRVKGRVVSDCGQCK